MKLAINFPNEAPYESGNDLKLLMLGEDSEMARKAAGVLQLLGRNLKNVEGRLFYQSWNIEVLAFTSLRELAAAEAATADLIILAIHEGNELPEMVLSWLQRLVDLRENRPGALVAMLDSDRKTPDASAGILSQLKRAAALGHLDFYAARAREGKVAWVARRTGEVVRQFVMARNFDARDKLPGPAGVPAELCFA